MVAVIGTGKRTGKTALGTHLASLLRDSGAEPVVVSMGRGGPPEPVLVRAGERPGVERLLEIARAGGHAASDYLEDAVLAGVTTVGCRRCGEGPAGETFESNVLEGLGVALRERPDVVVLEGSGAALPPVAPARDDLRDDGCTSGRPGAVAPRPAAAAALRCCSWCSAPPTSCRTRAASSTRGLRAGSLPSGS